MAQLSSCDREHMAKNITNNNQSQTYLQPGPLQKMFCLPLFKKVLSSGCPTLRDYNRISLQWVLMWSWCDWSAVRADIGILKLPDDSDVRTGLWTPQLGNLDVFNSLWFFSFSGTIYFPYLDRKRLCSTHFHKCSQQCRIALYIIKKIFPRSWLSALSKQISGSNTDLSRKSLQKLII